MAGKTASREATRVRLADTTKRIDKLKTDVNTRFGETNKRFDSLTNEYTSGSTT